jgi:hypothetical protein
MATAREHGITKLYNYQPTLDNLESTLRENQIHCSNPANFNDPWDCKPYFDPSSIDEPEQQPKWVEFFKKLFAASPREEQKNILQQYGSSWYEHTELLRESITKITMNVGKNNADRYRIFCLTINPASLLMWAHYGNKHQGLCLEFDATVEKVWRARKVAYGDKLPLANADYMRDNDALLEVALLTKSLEWRYEEEYRLLGRDGKLDPTFILATEGNFLKLPVGAITGVIAGVRADIDRVREIVHRVAPGLPIRRAVQRPHEYHLDITADD